MNGFISVAEQQRALRIQRWLPPDVSLRPEPEIEPEVAPPPPPAPTPEEIAAIQEAARQEGLELGYREGYEAGYQAGRAQAEEEAARERAEREAREQAWRAEEERRLTETVAALEGIARALADPLAESVEVLEPELLSLVTALARQVVMAELRTQPELIQQVLHEALKQLPSRHHPVRVQVNPEDQAILASYAQSHDERISWIPDPAIERGGCIVLSGPSRIDATLETRLRQGIEALWGELAPPAEGIPELAQGEAGESEPPIIEAEGAETMEQRAAPLAERSEMESWDEVAESNVLGPSEDSWSEEAAAEASEGEVMR